MTRECKKEDVHRKRQKRSSHQTGGKVSLSAKESLLKEEVVQEAKRCLGLRECEACDLCSLLCPDLCITRDEKTGEVLIDLDYCKGCGICAAICPKGAIQMVMEEGR